jgi:hypothetical protein
VCYVLVPGSGIKLPDYEQDVLLLLPTPQPFSTRRRNLDITSPATIIAGVLLYGL